MSGAERNSEVGSALECCPICSVQLERNAQYEEAIAVLNRKRVAFYLL